MDKEQKQAFINDFFRFCEDAGLISFDKCRCGKTIMGFSNCLLLTTNSYRVEFGHPDTAIKQKKLELISRKHGISPGIYYKKQILCESCVDSLKMEGYKEVYDGEVSQD